MLIAILFLLCGIGTIVLGAKWVIVCFKENWLGSGIITIILTYVIALLFLSETVNIFEKIF